MTTDPRDVPLDGLRDVVADGDVLVLTGAGISTASGIPDYRGPTGALRARLPMTYQVFRADPAARQRYWARSQLGWRSFRRAEPNTAHRRVGDLQGAGLLTGLLTQNVDGLHQAGGATDVVELHGNLDRVVCLGCLRHTSRRVLDERLSAANPDWTAEASRRITKVNPDGDVLLDDEHVAGFRVVDCTDCGGTLKPDVVFFGENVPPDKVAHCRSLVERCRSMLVLGSSLAVMSGLRFVRQAHGLGKPVVIVNQGWTRGDDLAQTKLDAELCEILASLTLGMTAQPCGSAWSMSSQRSSTSSTPTDIRSSVSGTAVDSPDHRRRRSIDDSTPPRLVACTHSSVDSHTSSAACGSPRSSTDTIAPKPG
jgi:NAD-dependent SIR2 family protein deacetylase